MTDVTQILCQIEQGDRVAAEQLLPLVYGELRKLAAAKLANEKPGHTLQATALVHDAYLRLVDQSTPQQWDGRGHFFAAAAEAMRRILVDHARHKKSMKRGGDLIRQEFVESNIIAAANGSPNTILAVHDALDEFSKVDPRAAELVKLRYFVGMTIAEAANVLNVSSRTANKWWNYAKAWLTDRIGEIDDS